VLYCTDVAASRTGVKQNDENWVQLGSFVGCCGGEVVVRAIGPTDFVGTDFNPL